MMLYNKILINCLIIVVVDVVADILWDPVRGNRSCFTIEDYENSPPAMKRDAYDNSEGGGPQKRYRHGDVNVRLLIPSKVTDHINLDSSSPSPSPLPPASRHDVTVRLVLLFFFSSCDSLSPCVPI